MFVVPLAGDSVETEGGVKYTILSYAAYKDQPAVYVESDSAQEPESVLFSAIKAINGTPVKLAPGKVFTADSLIKRKCQLPQSGDKVVCGGVWLKIKSLKLRENNKLTDGLLLICVDLDTKEQVTLRAAAIEQINRTDGDTESMRAFLNTYKEYLGTSSGI